MHARARSMLPVSFQQCLCALHFRHAPRASCGLGEVCACYCALFAPRLAFATFTLHTRSPTHTDEAESANKGAAGASGKAPPLWKVPTKGAKVIVIKLTRRSGNKNVTVISNLENFGIRLTDEIKKDIAKRFSVSVRYIRVGWAFQLCGQG